MRRSSFLSTFHSLRAAGAVSSVLAPIVDNRFVPYPFLMTFVVTRRCNSRCQMCSIWQEKDSSFLSLEQIEYIFSQNDFSCVRILALTGGEPTLRSDLPQLLEIVLERTPNLEHVQLATSGLNTRRTVEFVTRMLGTLAAGSSRVRHFEVQISLDGIGEVHDAVRGVPGCFRHVQDTLAQLRALQDRFPRLNLRLSSVVIPDNLSHIDALHNFARQWRLPIHYSPIVLSGEYYNNLHKRSDLEFSNGYRAAARGLFERLGEEEETSLRFYYQDMAQMIQGYPRSRRCMMGWYGFVLEHDGSVYPCINCEKAGFGNLLTDSFESVWFGKQADSARRQLRASCCPTCTSVCYPQPVNALEVIKTSWWRWQRRVKSQLDGNSRS
jgi:MoaA/NifB/PqqE/SkfB family radical SAM enzyme